MAGTRTLFELHCLRQQILTHPVSWPKEVMEALVDAVEAAHAYMAHEQAEPSVTDPGYSAWAHDLYVTEQAAFDALKRFEYEATV